jgi:DNA repair protein RecO
MKESNAIIISIQDFQNTSAIVTLLTQECAIIKSLAKGARRKDKNAIYQVGNYVYFKHFAKENTLGVISCETKKCYSLLLLDDRICLYAINAVLGLIYSLFPVGALTGDLFSAVIYFFEFLLNKSCDRNRSEITALYFATEKQIISIAGYACSLEVLFSDYLHKALPKDIKIARDFIASINLTSC